MELRRPTENYVELRGLPFDESRSRACESGPRPGPPGAHVRAGEELDDEVVEMLMLIWIERANGNFGRGPGERRLRMNVLGETSTRPCRGETRRKANSRVRPGGNRYRVPPGSPCPDEMPSLEG